MSKSSIFKTLIVFWAATLIIVGVIYYKNSRECSSCQADNRHLSTLDEYQKKRVQEYKAVLLVSDSGNPVYVDLSEAFTHPEIAAMSYDNPVPLNKTEIEKIMKRLRYAKYVNKMPLHLRNLLSENKLGILQSDDGDFFAVVLKESFPKDY